MKIKRIITFALFILSILSFETAIITIFLVGDYSIFKGSLYSLYSWIYLLFLPIPISSIIISKHLKKKNKPYKMNFISGIISSIILVSAFLTSFIQKIFVTYDRRQIDYMEEKLSISFPTKMTICNQMEYDYIYTISKINNKDKYTFFENEMINNEKWKKNFNRQYNYFITREFLDDINNFDYFIIYNIDLDLYYDFPPDGSYNYIFIKYNIKKHYLVAFINYKIIIN